VNVSGIPKTLYRYGRTLEQDAHSPVQAVHWLPGMPAQATLCGIVGTWAHTPKHRVTCPACLRIRAELARLAIGPALAEVNATLPLMPKGVESHD
jgi:hypothetical protein